MSAPPFAAMDTSDLVCLFFGGWLEDPIALPCGHITSRAPIIDWLKRDPSCPTCRANLSKFDAEKANRLHAIAELVAKAIASGQPLPDAAAAPKGDAAGSSSSASSSSSKPKPKWTATLTKLTNRNNAYRVANVGKLEIRNTNNAFNFKTLLIPVIDASGSMSGSPIKQAQSAMSAIVEHAYANTSLMTTMVAYANQARAYAVDARESRALPNAWVQDLSKHGGGTSFRAAFDEVVRVCAQHKDNPQISALEVLFMTDGVDSVLRPDQCLTLVDEFKRSMSQVWARPYTVHVIGFTQSHNAEFLEKLRKIGSTGEGAYRFADPKEDIDSLSGKINSVVNVVVASSTIPIKLIPQLPSVASSGASASANVRGSPPVLSSDKDTFWVDLTGFADLDADPPSFTIAVDDQAPITLVANVVELDDDDSKLCKLWEQWCSIQIDQLAAELKHLTETASASASASASSVPASASSTSAADAGKMAAKANAIDRDIHFEFLRLRARAVARTIALRLSTDNRDVARLEQLQAYIQAGQAGNAVDLTKLSDMSFEGRFATTFKNTSGTAPNLYSLSSNKLMPSILPAQSIYRNQYLGHWTEVNTDVYEKTCRSAAMLFSLTGLVLGHKYQVSVTGICASGVTIQLADSLAEFVTSNSTHMNHNNNNSSSNSDGGNSSAESASASASSSNISNNGAVSSKVQLVGIKVAAQEAAVFLYPPAFTQADHAGDMLQRIQVTATCVGPRSPFSMVETTLDVPNADGPLAFGYLSNCKTEVTLAWFETHLKAVHDARDANESNLLHAASSINRGRAAEWMIAQSTPNKPHALDLHAVNKHGHNAMDLAIMHGQWYTFDHLWEAGVRPQVDPLTLLRTCLSKAHEHTLKMEARGGAVNFAGKQHKFYTTAARLFRYDLVLQVPPELINAVPWDNPEAAKWLGARSAAGVSMEKAMNMGMVEVVEDLLAKGASSSSAVAASSSSSSSVKAVQYSFATCFGLFGRPTNEHVQIVDRLATLGLVDVNETVPIKVHGMKDNHVDTSVLVDEISWPLFAAAEKGRTPIVKVILKHLKLRGGDLRTTIDRVNLTHVTALWIASCNGHIDTVLALLEAGANPNIPNEQGSSALIPCCMKGLDTVAQVLLDSDIDLEVYDPTRDHPILQCCRTGQAKVLESLLRHIHKQEEDVSSAMQGFSLGGDEEESKESDGVGGVRIAAGPRMKKLLSLDNPCDGYPPLMAAAELGHVDCMRLCVQYGADLEQRTLEWNEDTKHTNPQGATALHIACFNKRIEAVSVLKELGSDMMARTSVLGHMAMYFAVEKRSIELVYLLRQLLSADQLVKMNNTQDADGRKPAYYAYAQGNEALLEEFFTDRLSRALERVLSSDMEASRKCAKVMLTYGRTVGCFDFEDVTGRVLGASNVPILTKAILAGNKPMVEAFRLMGADWYQTDVDGRSAMFWATCIGYPAPYLAGVPTSVAGNSKVKELMDRVTAASSTSVQSKLLLNLSKGPPLLRASVGSAGPSSSSSTSSLGELKQMTDGFSERIDEQAILDIQSQASANDLSLLGWMEKLKSQVHFADGKEALEQLLWNAKVHVVGLLAISGGGQKLSSASSSSSATPAAAATAASSPSMSVTRSDVAAVVEMAQSIGWQPLHYMAVYLYTANGTIFQQVNQCLANWRQVSIWQPFVTCLHQAVSLLPEFTGECYRAIDQPFDAATYAVGAQLTWNSFAMSSLHWNVCTELIKDKRGVIFIIKSTRSRILAPYAANPADGQVVSLPGARFEVTNHFIADPICLGQANIREKTYRMYEQAFAKVLKGRACIIVELTERC